MTKDLVTAWKFLWISVVVVSGVTACGTLPRNPNVIGTYSDKLSPYNYKEDGSLVLMVVGVDGARFIRKEPYFPLFVEVANKSKQTFEIFRGVLHARGIPWGDGTGPPPRPKSRRNTAESTWTAGSSQQNRSITSTYVSLFTYIASDFYPSSARRNIRVNQVVLPPHAYMEDVLYFPIPESGLNGVPLRLMFKVKNLEEPIQVVFEVPKTLGVFEKDEPGDGNER